MKRLLRRPRKSARKAISRKVARSSLRQKADDLFSLFIRTRDGRCRRCASRLNLQCAHIFTRARYVTRFDPANAVALCAGCHWHMTLNPDEWTEWLILQIGQAGYDELRKKSYGIWDGDYERVLAGLKARMAPGGARMPQEARNGRK